MANNALSRPFGVLALVFCLAWPAAAQIIELQKIGGYDGGYGEGSAEISSYDSGSRRLFVINSTFGSVDIVDLSDPAAPAKVGTIDLSAYGPVVNSVDAYGGLVAIAVQAEPKTDPGKVVFCDTAGNVLKVFAVGSQPDMVSFSPNGKWVLTADEGEPNDAYTVDPGATVSLIDLSSGLAAATVRQLSFTDFNRGGSRGAELPPEVRIFGPNTSVAQDLEPEYIAFSADSSHAYITLQENNAIAVVDLAAGRIDGIFSLGFKNHSLPGNQLDPSDRDGGAHLANWPVYGMYLPDAIAAYTVGGQTFLLTANEGDSRDYPGFSEEKRVGNLTLDPTIFPNAGALQQDPALKRLKTTSTLGDLDGDGDVDRIYAFGARSFSIWRADNGGQVFDSGNDLELATITSGTFDDSRSDDKGPEPEGITVADLDGHQYAFVGLERTGGVVVYDISNPTSPIRVTYAPSGVGNVGPEGLEYISAANSPNGRPLLVASHEVSGTLVVYQIETRQPGEGNCVADATTLCLGDMRFQVRADYKTFRGDVGVGKAVAQTTDAGYFYFFDDNNVEVVVKVLDACTLHNRFWVFASGLTNLEVSFTVTDTRTGASKSFRNPLGLPFQPILDLDTFATCP